MINIRVVVDADGNIEQATGDYPWLNSYLYCAANPINIIDPTGQVLQICDSNGEVYTVQIEENSLTLYNAKNERVTPDDLQDFHLPYIINEDLNELIQSNIGMEIVSGVIDSDKTVTLSRGKNEFNATTGAITYDSTKESVGIYSKTLGYSKDGSPVINLCHEMAHAYDWVNGTYDKSIWYVTTNNEVARKSEIFACMVENQYRREIGFPRRETYVHIYNKNLDVYTPNWITKIPNIPYPILNFKLNRNYLK